jgi:hypothetical protein
MQSCGKTGDRDLCLHSLVYGYAENAGSRLLRDVGTWRRITENRTSAIPDRHKRRISQIKLRTAYNLEGALYHKL